MLPPRSPLACSLTWFNVCGVRWTAIGNTSVIPAPPRAGGCFINMETLVAAVPQFASLLPFSISSTTFFDMQHYTFDELKTRR